jgi:hypothetical protein
VTVRVSFPTLKLFAGTVKVYLPPESVPADEVNPPPDSVADPVGTGLSMPPLMATIAVNSCAVVMLVAEGDTVTVAVIFACVTVTVGDVPVALL